MLRLSIIIPHQQDDTKLETSLVSILENRPADCEIIVVHDGSYRDNYQIGDEARLLEFAASGTTELLNAAVREANGESVVVILNGNTVLDGWADEALDLLEKDVSTSSVAVGTSFQDRRFAGITSLARCTAGSVMRGAVADALGSVPYAGPTLNCGFYRRSTLLAIGGWNERLDTDSADVELAWLLQSVGLVCECVTRPQVQLGALPNRQGASTLRQLAELSVAYGITGSGSLAAATGWLSALPQAGFGGASAWASGLMGGSITRSAIARLKLAQRELADSSAENSVLSFPAQQTRQSLPKAA